MTRIVFPALLSRPLVARYFALQADFPERFLNANRRSFYQEMHIRKRNPRVSGFRRVYKVTDRILRNVHKQLAVAVQESLPSSKSVHGFMKDRSTVTNAVPHLGANIVLRLDIRNFFESIPVASVERAFVSLGASEEAASLLSEFATLDGRLVQGASSSPAISNLVCVILDRALESIAQACGATYTRYSDDLTFSGHQVPDPDAIEQALKCEGFVLAREKVRYQKKGRFQYVTGVSVADPKCPRAPRRLKRWLRSVVHAADTHGLDSLVERFDDPYRQRYEVARIDGSIAYLYAIEPKAAAALDRLWQPALMKGDWDIKPRRQSLYMTQKK
jgi:RNA-directed DNA polymerase